MPVSPAYTPDPAFFRVADGLADPVTAAAFPNARLRWRDDDAARTVGLQTLTGSEWRDHFAGFSTLPDNQPAPLAMRYHGHQFRVYNPDIGDGRGFLFAQMRDDRGRLMDLGTKGSGQTPYSRNGDGRMTLQGGVREALFAAHLHAAGVPTCRILSLYDTDEQLDRYDEPSPARGAVMVRLQHSHIRIGHFQRHAYHGSADALRTLTDHVAQAYFPSAAPETGEARVHAVFDAAVSANAALTADWMAASFVHGVMNSDNITLTGESFDYGPSRVLPVFQPGFTAAYFDQGGIYAYGRQPEAMAWNLHRLAECLALIAPVEPIEAALNDFPHRYAKALHAAIARRFGTTPADGGATLADAFFAFAKDSRAPFEAIVFDWFGAEASQARAMAGPRARYYAGPAFAAFRDALGEADTAPGVDLAHDHFQRDHPIHLTVDVTQAIWGAIDYGDDWGPFQNAMQALQSAREAYSLGVTSEQAAP